MQALKSKIERLKALCPKLAQGQDLMLEEGVEYGLLPANWVLTFRHFLTQSGSKVDAVNLDPPLLGEAMDELMCDCHCSQNPLLRVAPRPAIRR